MKCLIRERLSEHKYKTPEGYLICVDSILARTGKQSYRRSELFQDGDDSEIDVDRPENEVFSPATLASFENKPIVVEHPDEDVNANNIKQYAVGFVRDVKRGKTEDGQDVMLGTLVIQDAETIEEIENGEHTDLSCGYDCDIADEANPTQRNIRGNHVALCAQGRAGIAKIVDSVKILDFDAQLQENKLSKTSIEYRKKLNEQPQNKKALLLEAENIIKQIVDDTDVKDKPIIQKYADKHLADIRAFAASLEDSIKDAISKDYEMWVEKINGAARANDEDLLKVYIGIIKNDKHLSWVEEDELIRRIKRFLPRKSAVDDKLIESSSEEAFSKNIATEIKAGKDPKQAAAIAYNIKKENDSMNDSKKFTIYQVTPFGRYKIVEWEADSKDEAVKEFLELNPKYKSKGGIIADSVEADDIVTKDSIKKKDNTIKDGLGLANLRALINMGEVDTSRVNTTGEVIIKFKNDADKKDAMRKLYQHRVPIDSEKGLTLYIDAERILSTVNDSMIKDAKYAIWVKEKGQWKPWGSTDKEIDVNELKKRFNYYEDVTLMPNDGSKPRDSVNDAKFLITAYKDGKLLEEQVVGTRAEAEKLANQFETKHGKYTTTIKLVYDSVNDTEYYRYDYKPSRSSSNVMNTFIKANSENEARTKIKQKYPGHTNVNFVGLLKISELDYEGSDRSRRLDSDTFEEVTEELKKNEPNVDDIMNAVNAVKAVRRSR